MEHFKKLKSITVGIKFQNFANNAKNGLIFISSVLRSYLPILFPNNYNSHKKTAAQKKVTLIYHRVCGLYFLTIAFATTIAL